MIYAYWTTDIHIVFRVAFNSFQTMLTHVNYSDFKSILGKLQVQCTTSNMKLAR